MVGRIYPEMKRGWEKGEKVGRREKGVLSYKSVCSVRLAAAMLRRAFVLPILAAPPVRAIQALTLSQSKVGRYSAVKRRGGVKRIWWGEYVRK
jgi:hypothetical protein